MAIFEIWKVIIVICLLNNNIFNYKWAVTRWQWLFCMYINMNLCMYINMKFYETGFHLKSSRFSAFQV